MKRIFSQVNIYTLVALIYTLSGSLFPGGNVLTASAHLAFLGFSFFYFLQVLTKFSEPSYIKALNLMVLIILLYGGVLLITGSDRTWMLPVSNREFLRSHIQSIFPIYAFYYFSRKKIVKESWFKYAIAVFLVATIYHYYTFQAARLLEWGRDEMTNNIGYMFLSLLPTIAFHKNKPAVFYTLVGIVMIFLLMSMKRGAILIGAISFIYIILTTLKTSSIRKKLFVVIMAICAIFFIVRFADYMLENSSYFLKRIQQTQEGNMSSRADIYSHYLDYFLYENNILKFLLGNGAYGTCHYLGLMAHNDWLEYAIDLGLVGLITYLVYWVKSYKLAKLSIKICPDEISMCIVIFVGIYFLKSIFSMSFMEMEFYATSAFGYSVAKLLMLQENPNAEIE